MQNGQAIPRELDGSWIWERFDENGCFLCRSALSFATKQEALNGFEREYVDYIAIMAARQ